MSKQSKQSPKASFDALPPHLTEEMQESLSRFCAFEEISDTLTDLSNWGKIIAALNEKRFTAKDADTSYRKINSWTESGLLDDDREAETEWRRLSFKDLFWLRILRELRQFGLPLEKLKATYQTLFFEDTKPSERMEAAISVCGAIDPIIMFIIVFNDGEADFATLDEMHRFDSTLKYSVPYIRINLNTLLNEMLNTYAYQVPCPSQLSEAEDEVIKAIRNDNNDEVSVHLKSGGIDRIEQAKRVQNTQNIAGLLQKINYGEISVKIEHGKAVHVRAIKKTRPKK